MVGIARHSGISRGVLRWAVQKQSVRDSVDTPHGEGISTRSDNSCHVFRPSYGGDSSGEA